MSKISTVLTPVTAPLPPFPPGNRYLPFIGETVHVLLDPRFVQKRVARYGPIFATHIAGAPVVMLVGAEANRHILSNPDGIFGAWLPPNMRVLVQDAVVTQDGAQHAATRTLLAPAFGRAALERYFAIMDKTTRRYLDRWAGLRRLVWHTEFKQFAAEIACRIFLGAEDAAAVAQVVELFDHYSKGFATFLPLRHPRTAFGRAVAARAGLLAYLREAIDARRHHPTDDALSLLLAARDDAGNSLSDAEVMDQALLLLFAGHETTATFLTFAVWELARHPDVLMAARAEQDALGLGWPTARHLHHLPYMEQVIKEVERLHPPAIGSFRRTVKEFQFGGYRVPAGTNMMYSTVGTHRDPTVFPDPDRFDPDRHADGRAALPPLSLIAFGGGERSCLGFGFAQMEMRLMLAYLIRYHTWRVLPRQNLSIAPIPTQHIRSGLHIEFGYRQK